MRQIRYVGGCEVSHKYVKYLSKSRLMRLNFNIITITYHKHSKTIPQLYFNYTLIILVFQEPLTS